MHLAGVSEFLTLLLCICNVTAFSNSTAGIEALVQRRLPNHAPNFNFFLTSEQPSGHAAISNDTAGYDRYTVSNGPNSTISISGTSPVALAAGLRWYLTNLLHVDIYWFIGSRLHLAPERLPQLNSTHSGASTVKWRYHFNTVTFSYTSAFWTWNDWELQLDWMALRGINLPLAWVGNEKILVDTFQEAGFSDADISSFLSGPAFQAWNRFGNIQGSWGGQLPASWIESQFSLNKRIVGRMVELGMTPVLPCFTGFVPEQIGSLYANASFVNGSQWSNFPTPYTNVTFLEPSDPLYLSLQKIFISKQVEAYGNVSNVYTLDQYNENNPFSGNVDYLRNVSSNTIKTLKAADPQAIWLIQGWLFYSSESFWTNDRVEAYLGGVNDTDMLILDLFSESQPQWQRTNSYFGKPWIWCQLHDYGGNMGLYGQLENVTQNPVAALANTSSTMVGMGLTMEGEEGNEVVYDLLLDQAWSVKPINTATYFSNWVTSRYYSGGSSSSLPQSLYTSWDTLRKTVYNNTELNKAQATTKSILELSPNTTGLLNRTGHHPTTITYDTGVLIGAWQSFYNASVQEPGLWDNEAYAFDLTDITRQVLANAFDPFYITFVQAANSSSRNTTAARKIGATMIRLLSDLDAVLTASDEPHFSLAAWIASARAFASNNATNSVASSTADFYEYNARNQITLWGPTGEISDYASKSLGGLIGSYYIPRWQRFINYTLNSTTSDNGQNDALSASLLSFEEQWQTRTWGERLGESYAPPQRSELQRVIAKTVRTWPDIFGQ